MESNKEPVLREREFKTRNSYITDLMQNEDFRPIYYVLWLAVFFAVVHQIFYDFLLHGRLDLRLHMIAFCFVDFHIVFACWIVEHCFAVLVYFGIKMWTKLHAQVSEPVFLRISLNSICLTLYVISQLSVAILASTICQLYNIPVPTALALSIETTRLLMKMHSFVRTNVSSSLGKSIPDPASAAHSTMTLRLGHFIYFLFAPTLLYRNSYPRSKGPMRLSYISCCLMEIFGILYIFALSYESFIKVHFHDFGLITQYSVFELSEKFFAMFVPGIICLLGNFYITLHAIQNLFAEILHFGDRMFYKNWWNAPNFKVYFLKWNCIVQDWLYEYVYKDLFFTVFCGSRLIATLAVFTVSAVVHELILIVSFRLFFPFIYCSFGLLSVVFTLCTTKLPAPLGNIFLWFSLIIGSTTIIALYSAEYFTKLNCAPAYRNLIDYFLPQMWNCYKQSAWQ